MSGLLAAYFLNQKGLKVQVLESSDRPGGWVQTIRIRDQVFENGPNSILADQEWLSLFKDLNLSYLEKPKALKNRFIWKSDRRQPIPLSLGDFLFSSLLSTKAKLSVLKEIWKKNELKTDDPSLAEFFLSRFHSDIAYDLVDPFVGGVFAGDISRLSCSAVFPDLYDRFKQRGSVVKAALFQKKKEAKKILSFERGMEALIESLRSRIQGRWHERVRVQSIDLNNSLIRVLANGNEFEARGLILAVPASEAARLLKDFVDERSFEFLQGIFYQKMTLIHTLWRRPRNFESGLGCLIPSRDPLCQGFRGSLWPSEIFPSRYNRDFFASTQYYSGESAAIDLRRTQKILGIDQEPIEMQRIDLGPCIPQFTFGHRYEVSRVREQLPPNLQCVGNYLDGVGLSSVFKTSKRATDEILAAL
jgi:oxygen-dependent protoporphyrinogen oxidase